LALHGFLFGFLGFIGDDDDSSMGKTMKLLTEGNPKTIKGQSKGYQTFILHLSPAQRSGFEMCRWRTKGCTDLCLNTTGHGGIFKEGETTNAVQTARERRTIEFMNNREQFLAQLVHEMELAIRRAERKGLIPVFRPNGTSDQMWEWIPVTRGGVRYGNIFAAFADYQFYDYTKAPYAERRHDIPNYHLTFSFAETLANNIEAGIWFNHGHSVAVVFGISKKTPFPTEFRGQATYNADEHDLRFLDPHGIAALRAKGNAWKRNRNQFIN
jgi:hypothetical protein